MSGSLPAGHIHQPHPRSAPVKRRLVYNADCKDPSNFIATFALADPHSAGEARAIEANRQTRNLTGLDAAKVALDIGLVHTPKQIQNQKIGRAITRPALQLDQLRPDQAAAAFWSFGGKRE